MDEREYGLKKEELEIQRKQLRYNVETSKTKNKERLSIYIGLVIAIIGIFGNLANHLLQGNLNERLEKQIFESDLIKWALESDDREQNRLNLKFLLDGQLITDPNGALQKLVSDTSAADIPFKSNFRCIEIVARDRQGKVVNFRRKCSEDTKYLNDYIDGFTKASKEQNRTVQYKWLLK